MSMTHSNPDAELIAACEQHDALERQYLAVFEGPNSVEADRERDKACEPIKVAQAPLLDRICALRATTPAGQRARARTFALWKLDLLNASEDRSADDRLMAAIARDLIGDGAESTGAAQEPDAALMELCRQHAVAHAAVNTGSSSLDDGDPLWVAYTTACDGITNTQPQTMAGVLAKARAAHVEALQPNGSYSPGHCPAETWAWSVAQDVLRLNGRCDITTSDTALLAACREFERLQCAVLAAEAAMPTDAPDEGWGDMDRLMERRWAVSDQIKDMVPITPCGQRAKAAVAVTLMQENGDADRGKSPNFALATLRNIAESVA